MADEKEIQELPDRIYDNFFQSTIFITGGTGFIGKVIIERLLRVLDVKKVYILIRFKKNKSPQIRLREMFENPLFQKVRELKGEKIFEKCIGMKGDVTKNNLDLAEEDYEILKKEVDYVIHSAATVKFDEPLRQALLINTKGAFLMLQLAKEMQKLKCFAYISTTFSHPEVKVLEEKVYRSKHHPERLIELIDWFDDETIGSMAKTLLNGVPNPYTFSKALAEDLVADAMDTIPAIILRPSIVVPIWKEPIPGWFDNVNGPMGAMIAAGKGVLRTMYGNKDMFVDVISVDAVADAVLVFSAYSMINRFSNRVYNICTKDEVGVTWEKMYETGKTMTKYKTPFDVFLWVPGGCMRSSKISYYFILLLTQLIPALLIDTLLPLFGYKPFLWRIQMRIVGGLGILDYYTCQEWIFDNHCLVKVREWLNAKEINQYTVVYQAVNMEEYMENSIYCARRYILKEPDENIPMARRRMKIMVYVDKICNILLKVLLAYLFYKWILLEIWNLL